MSEQTNYLDLARKYIEAQRALEASHDEQERWKVSHASKIQALLGIHRQFADAVGPDAEGDCRCFLVGCHAVIVLWDQRKYNIGEEPITTLIVEVEDGNHHHCAWP